MMDKDTGWGLLLRPGLTAGIQAEKSGWAGDTYIKWSLYGNHRRKNQYNP